MNNVEIERKFLLNFFPDGYEALPAVKISQGFLNTDKARTTRIRVTSEGEAFLTVKGASIGAVRVEIETSIDLIKAQAMLAMVDGAVVEKFRRKIIHEGKVWEIDEFIGANKGLIIAEIELNSESESFAMPPWAGDEVTTDHRYANSSLAKKPMPAASGKSFPC